MQVTRRAQIASAVGLGLAGLPFLRLAASPPPLPPRPVSARQNRAAIPRTPSEAALRTAREYRKQAQLAVQAELNGVAQRELPSLDAWDPGASATLKLDPLRQQMMARDRCGYLWQARASVLQAAALARTAEETYRAAELLARIECDGGRHAAELQQARKLIALRPRDKRSLESLRHAAICNGLGVPADRSPGD